MSKPKMGSDIWDQMSKMHHKYFSSCSFQQTKKKRDCSWPCWRCNYVQHLPVFCFSDYNATLQKLHILSTTLRSKKLGYLFKNNRLLINHGATVHISSHYSMLLIGNITSISAFIKFSLWLLIPKVATLLMDISNAWTNHDPSLKRPQKVTFFLTARGPYFQEVKMYVLCIRYLTCKKVNINSNYT